MALHYSNNAFLIKCSKHYSKKYLKLWLSGIISKKKWKFAKIARKSKDKIKLIWFLVVIISMITFERNYLMI